MQLTSQDFAEVLGHLRAAGVPADGFERRQATRVSIQSPVYVAPVISGRPGPVRMVLTRDLSCMGIGLMQTWTVTEDQTFIVKLPKQVKRPLFVMAKPMQCRLMAENIYAVGGEFMSLVNLDPVDAARFETPVSIDRIRSTVLT